jgi:hypothetical protein
MAAYHPLSANLVGGDEPQHLQGIGVDAELLALARRFGRVFRRGPCRRRSATLLLSEGV